VAPTDPGLGSVARRLLVVQSISELGDFIGLSTILLLAYHSTHSAIGPASIFAAQAIPALLVGTVASGMLDRSPRRPALVALAVVGAATTALVAAFPVYAAALVAAAVLAGMRTSALSITCGLVVDSVPAEIRGRYFTRTASINQVAQVAGFFGGSLLAIKLGVSTAIGLDAVTFVVGGLILLTLPKAPKLLDEPVEERSSPLQGLRVVFGQPVLRILIPVVWATVGGDALPQALAPRLAHGSAVSFVIAAFPAGGAAAAIAFGRSAILDRVKVQLRIASGFGAVFIVGGVALWLSHAAVTVAVVNFVLGLASVWICGTRATFAYYSPPGRVAQVEATMVASIVVVGGVGTLALAGIADATEPWVAYVVAGALVAVTTILSFRSRHRIDEFEPDLVPLAVTPTASTSVTATAVTPAAVSPTAVTPTAVRPTAG
jgi:Major Facilitator Superfamily